MAGKRYVSAVASALKTPRKTVEKVLDRYLAELKKSAAAEGAAKFLPMGSLLKRHSASRKGINPRTRESVTIPAHDRMVFHPSSWLRKKLNAQLGERQAAEKAAFQKKKEQDKFIPFDRENPAGPPEPVQAVVEPAEPAGHGGPPTAGAETAVTIPAAEVGSEGKIPPVGGEDMEKSEVEAIIRQTTVSVQKRMLLWAGGALLAVVVLFLVLYLVSFRGRGFERLVRTHILQVNRETRMTYEEMDKLVTERMKDLQLDMSQTRDMFKKELTAMQDDRQRRIAKQITDQVRKELRSLKPAGGPEPAIRIVRYTVRKGDNLWRISELKLKDPYQWVGLYKTNGKKIRDPDLIYPGQEILIPIVLRKSCPPAASAKKIRK